METILALVKSSNGLVIDDISHYTTNLPDIRHYILYLIGSIYDY